jgi:hypothetical protein
MRASEKYLNLESLVFARNEQKQSVLKLNINWLSEHARKKEIQKKQKNNNSGASYNLRT